MLILKIGKKSELVSHLFRIHGSRSDRTRLVRAQIERATLRARFSVEIRVNVLFQVANDLARQSGKSAGVHALAQSWAAG